MKLSFLKTAASLLAAAALASSVQALPLIVGEIHLAANDAIVTIDKTTDFITFTPSVGNTNATNARVSFRAGDYTSVASNQLGEYKSFSYVQPGSGVVNLWSLVLGSVDASFSLTSITSVDESGAGVVLTGIGIAYLDGFDPTPGFWSFSASQASPTASFSFSSTNISPIPGVPDGGATVVLLGVGLLGVGFISRRLKR